MSKKLRRGTFDRKIFGGTGIAVYFILALVIPKDDYIEYK